MAKVSIHCDGTDIYIVPDEKKTKTQEDRVAHKEKEEELQSLQSNDTRGHKTTDGAQYDPLLPYEFNTDTKSNPGFSNSNGNSNGNSKTNGKGILLLEKVVKTEKEQLTGAAAEAERRHRTIMDEIPEAYFAVDLTGNFIFANDSMCRLLGYSREELMSMGCRDHITEESYASLYKVFEDALHAQAAVNDFHCQVIRKDGAIGIAEVSAYPLKDEAGEVVGFRCIGRDATDRVKMEQSLKQGVERYRVALEDIDEIYFEVDLCGNFTYVNDAACRQLRLNKEDIIGTNYRNFIPEDEIEGVYQTWNKVYRSGEPITSYHSINIWRCGQRIYLEDSISPVLNGDGKIVGFRSISRDITERKIQTEKIASLPWPEASA
ncbi:MAG TPA: PAS domain-containing protein [Dehalococcoidia bacterium]